MLSRIFWIFMVGVALVAGALLQGRWLFSVPGEAAIERSAETAIEARVERAVDRNLERMKVVGSDGRTIDVSPQTKRELGEAVRRLVAAEADLAIIRIRDRGDAAAQEARIRRAAARADVDRLKSEIERQEKLSQSDRNLMRQQIRQEIRTSVRETIRSAVRN